MDEFDIILVNLKGGPEKCGKTCPYWDKHDCDLFGELIPHGGYASGVSKRNKKCQKGERDLKRLRREANAGSSEDQEE